MFSLSRKAMYHNLKIDAHKMIHFILLPEIWMTQKYRYYHFGGWEETIKCSYITKQNFLSLSYATFLKQCRKETGLPDSKHIKTIAPKFRILKILFPYSNLASIKFGFFSCTLKVTLFFPSFQAWEHGNTVCVHSTLCHYMC